jgi:hypothetical protein
MDTSSDGVGGGPRVESPSDNITYRARGKMGWGKIEERPLKSKEEKGS